MVLKMADSIREASCEDKELWNRFVDENNGSFFQYYEWKKIHELQGYKTFFMLVENSNKDILGIFPFVKIPMFLNVSIHSMPLGGAYGCPLSRSSEVIAALMKRMDEICISERAVYAHILVNPYKDNTELIKCCRSIGYKPRYAVDKSPNIFILDATNYDVVWKSFDRMVRKAMRKAKREGVSIVKNDWNLLDAYYSILIENRKRIKAKIIEERIFHEILNLFRGHIELYMAIYKERPIAGMYCFDFQNIRYLFDNVSIPECMKYRPNNLLYGEVIKDACEMSHIDKIDLGSTAPNSSYFRWKKQYGGTPIPLQYYEKTYNPVKKLIREKTVRPRVMIRRLIWSKLVSHEQINGMSPKMRKFLEWF